MVTERSSGGQHASPTSSSVVNDLPVRTACNYCRGKKIKCDKVAVEDGGCGRCRKEGLSCCYETREPIGRPKKRRVVDSEKDVEGREIIRSWSGRPERDNLIAGESSGWHAAQQQTAAISSAAKHWPLTSANMQTSGAISPTSTRSLSSNLSASLGMTPSTSMTSTTYDAAAARTSELDRAPTLTDLGLAVFLESLDTLEINPEDGLTPNMLATLSQSAGQLQSSSAFPSDVDQSVGQQQAISTLSLANMHGSTSYAVPADLSWADPSWIDRQSAGQSYMQPTSVVEPSHNTTATAQQHWPRGKEAGMGQAELRTVDGTLLRPAPSCCSGKAKKAPLVSDRVNRKRLPDRETILCPKTGKLGCCCVNDDDEEDAVELHEHGNDVRVHCVPDPTGRGCTCLCDVSVALINVRATLRRQAQDEERNDHSGGTHLNAKKAASTLQLTLSASQAVAAQCACSASCPTCRSDPSTSLSASLLVSTALQIYIRAVRTLRQGFGATGGNDGTPSTVAAAADTVGHFHSVGSEWDVSIGNYKPKTPNARRIALFAMKLELRDLRDAISKVSRAANASSLITPTTTEADTNSTGVSTSNIIDGGVNPIDQVVIRKLHQQLGDLLRTVETIEEQQDAERLAHAADENTLWRHSDRQHNVA